MSIPNGWLLLYIAGSIPVFAMWAMGLSGWFFEYPLMLVAGLLMMLAAPVVMLAFGLPQAALCNVIALAVGAGLITLRIAWGLAAGDMGRMTVANAALLGGIVAVSVGWAGAWIRYFYVTGAMSAGATR